MRSKNKLFFFFLLILILILISACTDVGDPANAIEQYLQAIVNKDEILAINLSCAQWEEQAKLEALAYQGVDVALENASCSVVDQESERALVECSGQFVFSYGGGESQVDELGGRIFEVVSENAEWRMCGMSDTSALSPPEIIEIADTPSPEPLLADPTMASSAVVTSPSSTDVPQASPTPTPNTRLTPDLWRTWPIIPELSPWLRDVYDRGLEAGNNTHAFSKVGDCQNITDAFLGIFDSNYFTLNNSDQYLQGTIDQFEGSWGRDSISVDGGFNFPAVFSALRADPEICNSGETPIECEIRLNKPIFVIIAMEFYYVGRTADNYQDYLEKTVEFALSQNVIPILATKADNMESDHSINLATAQVAYDYDLPLWNFWLAAQDLPDGGIDWVNDEEGFHITIDGWDLRSFTALQVIDALFEDLQNR